MDLKYQLKFLFNMKMLEIIKNKTFLKYLIFFLIILLIGVVLLYQLHRNQVIIIQQIKKNNSVEINKNITEADRLFDQINYDSAYFFYKKAIALCDPIDDYADDYVYSQLSIANLHQNTNNYTACEEALLKVFPYLKKTSKPKYTYNTYTLLAYNYFFTYDNSNALLYHRKALRLAATPYKKSVIINDIALVYLRQKRYKEIIDALEPLARIKIKHETDSAKTDINYSLLLNNLGFCYFKLGDPKALEYYKKSLKIQERLKSDYELMSTYSSIAMVYAETNPKLSKIYTEKQYQSACRAKSASFKANTLGDLIRKSEGKELKKYSKAYVKIIDSILSSRKQAKNQFSIIKYESKTDKEENLKLKAEKAENELLLQKHKNRNIISYIIITFTIAVLLLLPLYLFIKGEKEKKEAVFESEMRISKKLRNELTNKVYHTLLFAQNKDLQNDENKNQFLIKLDEIYSQTRNISRENSPIVTNEKYDLGLKEMISGFKTQNLNLLVNGLDTINWDKINKIRKIIIYRVLQELFYNMKKYNDLTLIVLSFKIINKNIVITYSDNSSKTQNERIILKKDLENVENRIKTTNGTLNFGNYTENGFKISFTFPL